MKNKCIELLKMGYTVADIQKELNISEYKWKNLGMVKLPKYNNIFSEINEVSAYWLGFLWADGSLVNSSLELELNINDIEHLKILCDSFSNIKRPMISIRTRHNATTCRINFSDLAIATSLRYLGFDKKGIRCIPNISEKMLPFFIKGYFDGDGSYIERNHNGNIEFRADICGPENFINFIEKYIPNPSNSEIINNKNWTSKRLYWTGKNDVKSLLNYFNNSIIKLIRKEPQLLQ